jgi:hypothetical protein
MLKSSIDTDIYGNSEQRLMVENILNVNFSVALYESLCFLNWNYQEERDLYNKRVSQAENEELLDYLQEMGHKPSEQKNTKDPDHLIYSTSTFFIRNNSG